MRYIGIILPRRIGSGIAHDALIIWSGKSNTVRSLWPAMADFAR